MMGGSDPRTLVLVGKTGNGKSATGNSILGNKMFESKRCFSGVTRTCELQTRVMEDGQMLNVIDTPGLLDSSVDPKTIGKEIVCCIQKAIDGIHAVLVVYSICNRFSVDEKAVITSLQELFGKKICDYMIVVFTCGDDLEENGRTLEDFLCYSPEALKEILCMCGNRFVLFDNRTKDETKKANQVQRLLSLVNMVVEKNGEPFTNEIFIELKMLEPMMKMNEEQLNRIVEMFELKLMEIKLKFERKLLEEQTARMRLEEDAKTARKKAEDDINRLREELAEAKKREEELNQSREKKREEKAKRMEEEAKRREEEETLKKFRSSFCVFL